MSVLNFLCVCFEYLVHVSTCAVCVTGVWRTEEDVGCPHRAVGSCRACRVLCESSKLSYLTSPVPLAPSCFDETQSEPVGTRLASEPPDPDCLRMDTTMPGLRGYLGSQLWPSGVWSLLYPPNRVSTPISLVSWDPAVISFQAFLQVSLSFPRSLVPCICSSFFVEPMESVCFAFFCYQSLLLRLLFYAMIFQLRNFFLIWRTHF